MADYKMATEQYAYSIGVGQGTPVNNRMATKSVAEALGCRIRNNTYANNLLVRLVDLWSCSCLGSTCNCNGNSSNCTCNSCNTHSSYICTCNSCNTNNSKLVCSGVDKYCQCNTLSDITGGNCTCYSGNTTPYSRSCYCQSGIGKYCRGHYTDSVDPSKFCHSKTMRGNTMYTYDTCAANDACHSVVSGYWLTRTPGCILYNCSVSYYRRNWNSSMSCGTNYCGSNGACPSVACTCNSCNTNRTCSSNFVSCPYNCSGHNYSAACGTNKSYISCSCYSNTSTGSCTCHSNNPRICTNNTVCSLKNYKEGTNT